MASHPYSPDRTRPRTSGTKADGSGVDKKSSSRTAKSADVMVANGDEKPMWFTEFGWSTNSLADWGVSEAKQAD